MLSTELTRELSQLRSQIRALHDCAFSSDTGESWDVLAECNRRLDRITSQLQAPELVGGVK